MLLDLELPVVLLSIASKLSLYNYVTYDSICAQNHVLGYIILHCYNAYSIMYNMVLEFLIVANKLVACYSKFTIHVWL